jgi:hypothetical protein
MMTGIAATGFESYIEKRVESNTEEVRKLKTTVNVLDSVVGDLESGIDLLTEDSKRFADKFNEIYEEINRLDLALRKSTEPKQESVVDREEWGAVYTKPLVVDRVPMGGGKKIGTELLTTAAFNKLSQWVSGQHWDNARQVRIIYHDGKYVTELFVVPNEEMVRAGYSSSGFPSRRGEHERIDESINVALNGIGEGYSAVLEKQVARAYDTKINVDERVGVNALESVVADVKKRESSIRELADRVGKKLNDSFGNQNPETKSQ